MRGLEPARPKVGKGAKSLDSDLGDVRTWSHSHYLLRKFDGVDEWKKWAG